MKKSGASQSQPASELISKRIAELGDWRGETLSRMRKLHQAGADSSAPSTEWKWTGTPVAVRADGIICTGESYKKVVKHYLRARARLCKDPARPFDSSLAGTARRATDIHEGAGSERVRLQGADSAKPPPSTVPGGRTLRPREKSHSERTSGAQTVRFAERQRPAP